MTAYISFSVQYTQRPRRTHIAIICSCSIIYYIMYGTYRMSNYNSCNNYMQTRISHTFFVQFTLIGLLNRFILPMSYIHIISDNIAIPTK